jgi:hypothetical protein
MFEFHYQNNVHLPKDKEYWQVTVSVTAESDAYIVLCEDRDPFSSPCYWIILGGWAKSKEGPKCVIRKCPDGVNSRGYPKGSCEKPMDTNYVSINTKRKLMCGTAVVSEPGG